MDGGVESIVGAHSRLQGFSAVETLSSVSTALSTNASDPEWSKGSVAPRSDTADLVNAIRIEGDRIASARVTFTISFRPFNRR
jgi:hypothetical protein